MGWALNLITVSNRATHSRKKIPLIKKGIEIVYLHCKLPFGLNLSIATRFYDAVYGASSFLFGIGFESKTMKVSDLPVTKIQNKNQIITNFKAWQSHSSNPPFGMSWFPAPIL